MPLPEDIRQEYLRNLGIDSYFPRVKLPHAPSPEACEWPQAWQAAALETAPQAQSRAAAMPENPPPQKPVPPRQAAMPARQPAAPEQATEELRDAEARPEATAEAVHLQALCIRVNGNLAIINVLPYLGQGQLGNAQRSLLHNLLAAAGIGTASLDIEAKSFRWPMGSGGHVDNTREAAAVALTAYLEQKQADWQFRQLLVMGELAIRQLFAESDVIMPGQAWQCFCTRSLDECLQQPGLKRELWPVLRQLSR